MMEMFTEFGWPQWTVAIVYSLGVILTIRDHGKPKTGNGNGFFAILAFGLLALVLHVGGFW